MRHSLLVFVSSRSPSTFHFPSSSLPLALQHALLQLVQCQVVDVVGDGAYGVVCSALSNVHRANARAQLVLDLGCTRVTDSIPQLNAHMDVLVGGNDVQRARFVGSVTRAQLVHRARHPARHRPLRVQVDAWASRFRFPSSRRVVLATHS
ncbi:hypothetical protein EXIGLDRAFT_196413 [Exidia glandulosa HHB12029]|uniref:Uncharacterized protein n=1 Tax=Exidia glandulosa HHB12029 TaxID=1314781 RepID=A0A165EU63_EXIGL|nr:hypothetical protein EXIGLDRAFT_196413 [Exidia glandulosa HHB12029]